LRHAAAQARQIEGTCERCGEPLTTIAIRISRRFCSPACKQAAYRLRRVPVVAKVLNIKEVGDKAAKAMIANGTAIYVGRKTHGWAASKWGNPFVIGRHGSRDEVIARYRAWITQQPELMAALPELRGKDVVCWCAPKCCHGDVLLELACK
jgi:hypothetical protein